MSCYSKEKTDRNDYNVVCKSHSARSDRVSAELYRICPSKLSKRELEDLYFSLLENNLDLKRTINGQDDKIRGLSTKVQRLTAVQKAIQGKEMKECCIGTKSIVTEQTECIAELKRANERMVDRIRMLNMRLCSAKQFSKKAPQMSTTRSIQCAIVSTPKRPQCLDKKNDSILKLSSSCQYMDRDAGSMRSVITETRDLEQQTDNSHCDENKCRTLMEELKLKIVTLQEELSHVHDEYSNRIGRLESEVSDVRKENIRVCSERRVSEHELQQVSRRNSELLTTLRTTEGRCAELTTQLAIEKRKVAELETRLKAASISGRVNKTIEDHTASINEAIDSQQDAKYAHPQAPKLTDLPECICNLPPEVNEKVVNEDINAGICVCPPPEDMSTPIRGIKCVSCNCVIWKDNEFVQSTPTKAEMVQSSSAKAGLLQSTATKADIVQLAPIKKEMTQTAPIKADMVQSAFTGLGMAQSTPTKDEVVQSTASKDSKCDNCCTCSQQPGVESIESSPIKTRTSPKVGETRSPRSNNDDGKMSKASDDSGYMDGNKSQDIADEAVLNKLNKELIRKILELQSQVDAMKIAGANEVPSKQYKHSENYKTNQSGTASSMASKSAAERSGTLFENLKATDTSATSESARAEVFKAKNPEDTGHNLHQGPGAMERDKINSDMSKDREMNKTVLQPAIKISIDEGTAIIATEEARKAVEKRKQSMSNGQMTSNGRTNGQRGFDSTKAVPHTLKMPSNERMKEIVPTKLKVPENKPGLDVGGSTSMRVSNGDRNPDKAEIIPERAKIQLIDERKLMENEEPGQTESEILSVKIKPLSEDVKANKQTEKLTEDTRRLGHHISTTEKETCELCPACTYESECASKFINKLDPKSKEVGARFVQVMKNDGHNSLQIPGPIPSTNTNNGNKEWKIFRRFSHDKKRDSKDKGKSAKQKKEQTKEDKQTVNLQDTLKNTYETTGGLLHLADIPILQTDKYTQITEKPKDSAIDSRKKYRNGSKESLDMHQRTLSNPAQVSTTKDGVPANDASLQNFYARSDIMPSISMQYNTQELGLGESKVELQPQGQNNQRTVLANNNAAAGRHREVSMYRRHSGTLCFRTLPTESPRVCSCAQQVDGRCVDKLRDKEIQVHDQEEKLYTKNGRRPSSTSDQGTYNVDFKRNRSTSPDNTDLEMSYMSDLPFERDAKSPAKRQPLSPGEDKRTTTYTDSSCSPATNYSLSEGEVPTAAAQKKTVDNVREKSAPARAEQVILPTQSMEAALQAISEELARCRSLLAAQRPTELSRKMEGNQSQISLPDNGQAIPLRRGVATQSIGDMYAPKCIFTLHIGTVVLSDEAVLNSRNKSLLLMWKFYDQNVAMTRMRAGRVVLFDFSTEYDIKITDDFLYYLKHEEMPMVICELDKENEPFATCSLPLRDALLHTNRRADLSLALVAGPQMVKARAAAGAAADALDAGDELGVIDLWCMLHADADLLPGINRAIAQLPSSHTMNRQNHSSRHNSRVMQQIIDDDRSNEYVDLDLTLKKSNTSPIARGEQTGKNVFHDEWGRGTQPWLNPIMMSTPTDPRTNVASTSTRAAEEAYDASKYPPGRTRSDSVTVSTINGEQFARIAPQREIFQPGPERDGSRLIVSEVEPKIKTSSDLKHALETGTFSPEFTRMPKLDEESVSQAHSSLASVRSILAKLQRRGTPKTEQSHDSTQRAKMLKEPRRVSKSTLEAPLRLKERDESSDIEIYRKYENIGKLIGTNKAESKKSVTIVPKYIESVLEEPQKDTSNPQSNEGRQDRNAQCVGITILWLALNEECEAMVNSHVQRVYIAYSFLGRSGADLETPISLPKPKHYVDKCYFNFSKTFELEDSDLPMLGHMARCRANSKTAENEKDCIIFSVVSEPAEDPLGLENCEDIGYAHLYLGDLLAYSNDSSSYTEVLPVRAAGDSAAVCGVLAVRLDGLHVVRRCLLLSSEHDPAPRNTRRY